jgi:hypothetical protein
MLGPLKRHYPDITSHEGNYPFVECAIFADETIVRSTYPQYTVWHYVDQPYLIDGGSMEDFPDFEVPTYTNVGALNAMTEFLMNTGDYKTTLYY